MKEFIFTGLDGFEINGYRWEVENPKACVQIIHGMGEYALRYGEFANFLNKRGYSVYADDHRGHGKTLRNHQIPGEIGPDGFNKMVEDEFALSSLIKKENPHKKLYVLGHSMGSFILQEYLIRYGNFVDKAVISGSCGERGLELSFGQFLAYLEMKVRKDKGGSKLIDFLTFKVNNLHFIKEKNKNAWLNRDKREIELYKADPLCGGVFPAEFYYYLYKGIRKLYIKDRFENFNKEVKIFIFSGEKDVIGKMGKGVKRLFDMYRKLGVGDIELKLYKDGRHEMLKEINKKEVFEDVLDFLNRA